MRSELFIGDVSVKLDEETRVQITKRIIDIQNPENRKTDRTLTFTLPGCPENDGLFGSIFEVNLQVQNPGPTQFDPDFNPNLRASFVYYVDTVEQIRGYIQLNDIKIVRENTVRYEVVGYGLTADLFSTIGDRLLTDLDFSEYDHAYTRDNIINSWATSIVKNGSPQAFAVGQGYVYPMIDYGTNNKPREWNVEDFKPAIYFKEYLDKIFDQAGFTYSSAFLETDRFKRLIMPFVAGEFKIDNDDAGDRLIDVERITSDQNTDVCDMNPATRSFDLTTATKLAFQQENFDPTNQWSTDTLTVGATGNYIFQGFINLAFRNNSGSSISGITSLHTYIGLIRDGGSGPELVASAISQTGIAPGSPWANGNTTSAEAMYFQFPEARLFVGDEIYIVPLYIADSPGTGRSGVLYWGQQNIQVVSKIGSFFTSQNGNAQIVTGDTITMNSSVPVDFKQKDFLTSLIRQFNLYLQPDPLAPNRLLIEPRDDYYTSDIVDWTGKLDEDRDMVLKPMGLLEAERYVFQYTPDTDYLGEKFSSKYGYPYGRRRITVLNQFIKNDKVIQPSFAPTPLVAQQGAADLIMSSIKFIDQDGQVSVKAAKPRALYYGGLKSGVAWVFKQITSSGISGILQASYPYAGHLDDPRNPTFDLNFGAPAEIYYGAAFATQGALTYTDNNLYRAYWQKFIEEVTDRNSKVMEAYLYLKPADIFSLSFRKQYFVKEAYYRLLEVSNYDPLTNAPTLCKFLKIPNITLPEVVVDPMYGGTGDIGGDTLPGFDLLDSSDGNKFRPADVGVNGSDNKMGGGVINGTVTGNDNKVGAGVKKFQVVGDGNIILADNAVVLNSDEQTVTEEGTTIINDIRYPIKTTVPADVSDIEALGAAPIAAIAAPGQGRFIEVQAAYGRRQNSTGGYSSEVLVLQYTGGVNAATFATELLTDTGDGIYKATVNPDLVENAALVLTTQSGGDPSGGDGDYVFTVHYTVQDI